MKKYSILPCISPARFQQISGAGRSLGFLSSFTPLLLMASSLIAHSGNVFGSTWHHSSCAEKEDLVVEPAVVDPSATVALLPGQRLSTTAKDRAFSPYTIQRLSGKAYWIESTFYSSTVLIGKKGVMVIDPLPGGRGQQVIAAIAQLTSLPITAVLYSHYQVDHIGGAQMFVDQAAQAGIQLKIFGTDATRTEIRKFGGLVPEPTVALRAPYDSFSFENIPVRVVTPQSGHSQDSSVILLPGEKVLHASDTIWPDWLPFNEFFGTQEIKGYENTLQKIYSMDWNFFNSTHGNIGSCKDVALVLDYLGDIRATLADTINNLSPFPYVDPSKHLFNWPLDYRDAVIEAVIERLSPKWGHFEEFARVGPSHVGKVFTEYTLLISQTF